MRGREPDFFAVAAELGFPMAVRSEYVIDEAQWEPDELMAVTSRVLQALMPSVAEAETDLPWERSASWPEDVREAATVLMAAYIPFDKRGKPYMRIRVQAVDDQTRGAFVAVAPYAFDCTLWAEDGELATLADEGKSLVMSLTVDEADRVRKAMGAGNLITLAEWRARFPRVTRRQRMRNIFGRR